MRDGTPGTALRITPEGKLDRVNRAIQAPGSAPDELPGWGPDLRISRMSGQVLARSGLAFHVMPGCGAGQL